MEFASSQELPANIGLATVLYVAKEFNICQHYMI